MDNLSVRRARRSVGSSGDNGSHLGTEEAENRHVIDESQVLHEV